MNRIFAAAIVSVGLVSASPAWAETPQTDTALIEQLVSQPADAVLTALERYYDLHVSELEVQLMRELNTGAFLSARRATGDGDTAEAKRQTDIFESTKEALAVARQNNQDLRQDLAGKTAISFADDLVMAPDVPGALPAAIAGTPAPMADARVVAWAAIEQARAHLHEVRLQLLEDQERYDKTRKVKIGDSMRAVTKAEVAMARAACDFRLVEARIAVALGKPLGGVLGGL